MNNNSLPENPPVILVADDDKSMRMLLRLALEQEGYQVIEAKNGEECLKAYQNHHPDMILLDAVMPIMDGFTACSKLQTLFGSEPISILMITVLDDPDSVEHAFEVGASDYITKPINWAVLRQRVRRLIQQSMQTRQVASLMVQLEAANQQLKNMVCLDSLTQLSNRRLFEEYLNQEWRRMGREKAPLSLLLCEIDYFSEYKNSHGYQASDECLQQVASVISHVVKRPADLVAYYRDGQFAVLLPQTPDDGAMHIAKLIQSEVQALEIVSGNSPANYITVSCAVGTTIPQHSSCADTLLTAVESAIAQSKVEGGDRIYQTK